jgi:putative ABC transport system ATP-binding protein
MLSIRNLVKSYRSAGEQVAVLRGVDLDVAAGESVALTGESGSGKSTLLHLIAGLDQADSGEVRLGETLVSKLPDAGRAALRRDRLGLVFQQFNLIPSLNVADNLVFQARIANRHDDIWHAELVERLALGDLLKRYPEQLSGGQQQRVAIARSLALSPEVMLFDEVTSALDPELTAEVLAVMEDLATRGMTMITVTHEMGFARKVANQVVFMHRGKIWESGPTSELFARPQTAEFKQFISSEL